MRSDSCDIKWYSMDMGTELIGVIKDALRLHPADRAKLIDALYTSLESDEMRVREQAWAREAESRLAAYEAGEIGSVSWDELKERLRKDRRRLSSVMAARTTPPARER